MLTDKRIIKVLSFVVLCGLSRAAPPPETPAQDIGFDPGHRYSVEELREDFTLLRTALEEGHAGLYFYSEKAEMDAHFDAVARDLDRPMTEPEFFRRIAWLIARVDDGHTGVTSSEALERHLSDRPFLFPFSLRFVRGKTYLFRNYSDDAGIQMGREVLAINDRPMSDILERMLQVIPSDGNIETAKYRRLESTEYFGRHFALLFGMSTSFEIDVRASEDGSPRRITVQGLRSGSLNRVFRERYPGAARSLPPMEVEYHGDTAVLTIRTFSDSPYVSTGVPFPFALRKVFQELAEKAVPHLIIDLRDNGGGADLNGRLLVSYLLDKPYMFYTHLEMNRNGFSFLEHTNAPDLEETLKARLRRNDKGTFDLMGHPNLGEQKPMQPVFRGRVFVLISGRSFSGAGECTSILYFHRRAEFVGEECGAGYYGNTSGFMPQLTLPNTGLRVRLPMLRYHMAVSGYAFKHRGIIPDYLITRSIQDLLSDRDTELEFALEQIKR